MTKKVLLVFADRESHLHWMTKRVMKRAGLQIEQFNIAYAYDPSLDIALNNCNVAVAMGQVALQALTGEYQPFRWIAKQVRHRSGCWIVGAMDPIRLLPNHSQDEDDDEEGKEEITRNPARFTGAVALALRKALALNSNPDLYTVKTNYVYDPSPEWFSEYVDEIIKLQPDFLSWDIETPYVRKDDDLLLGEQPKIVEENAVIRISFCYTPGYAVSIPWDYGYLPHIKRLFKNYKGYNVGWNSLDFDVPYLLAKGYEFLGKILDGMDAWHWLFSDLDRGLEHVTGYFTDILPWKHLSKSEPAHYSCIDADSALRNTLAIVQALKDSGGWSAYEMASIDLMMPVLYPAGRRGVKINKAKQDKLKTDLIFKLDQLLYEIQELVPAKFKRFKQLTRPGKSGTWTPLEGVKEQRYCSKCDQVNVSVSHPCVKSGEATVLKRPTQGTYYIQPEPEEGKIREWIKQNGFNPNSTEQLRTYIRANGHPLGQNHKNKNPDEAVDAKHLKKLAGKYGEKFPLYRKTLEIHKISKALSTYCYVPDAEGLIHTTFTNKPSTWRLASENVNLHNVGKREDNPYARMARETIEPLPGHLFLQGDSSAIEAVLVGYFMNDHSYMELAKKSIHAYLVCKWHGWEWNSENLAKAKKDSLYDMMKRTVHGTNYGMGYRLLYSQYQEMFSSTLQAKQCQDFLFKVLPQLEEWQHQIRVRAQKECYLESPWKHRHYFYDVFSYRMSPSGKLMYAPNGRPLIRHGKDSKRAVAYLPQHSGGMFMRENLVILGNSEYGKYMGANCNVHDSLCLMVPEKLLEPAKRFLIDLLTRPILQLGGLRIGAEIEVGENWLGMKNVEKVTV